MPVRVQPDLEPPGLGLCLCLYHYFCLCAATSRVRERGVEWREPLKQTAYYANDSCDAHGWADTASSSLSCAFLGAPLITEEVARAEGDGRSWRMDATAFEFVYLSFVNSMFLSTFALLSSVRSFGCLFICLSLACVPPFPNPIAIAAPILRLRLVNIPLPIEFVSIYLLHRQNGANFVCAMRPITTWSHVLWCPHPHPRPHRKTPWTVQLENEIAFHLQLPGQDFQVFPFLEFMQKQFRFTRCCQLPGVGFLITRPNECGMVP